MNHCPFRCYSRRHCACSRSTYIDDQHSRCRSSCSDCGVSSPWNEPETRAPRAEHLRHLRPARDDFYCARGSVCISIPKSFSHEADGQLGLGKPLERYAPGGERICYGVVQHHLVCAPLESLTLFGAAKKKFQVLYWIFKRKLRSIRSSGSCADDQESGSVGYAVCHNCLHARQHRIFRCCFKGRYSW